MIAYNPDYIPVGRNNKANPYYKQINHVKIPKSWDGPRVFTPGLIERTTLIIFNTGAVPDPVPSGTYVQMSWTADGQARQVGITTSEERSKASVMQELATMSRSAAGTAGAVYVSNSVRMRSELDVVLSAPVLTVDVPPQVISSGTITPAPSPNVLGDDPVWIGYDSAIPAYGASTMTGTPPAALRVGLADLLRIDFNGQKVNGLTTIYMAVEGFGVGPLLWNDTEAAYLNPTLPNLRGFMETNEGVEFGVTITEGPDPELTFTFLFEGQITPAIATDLGVSNYATWFRCWGGVTPYTFNPGNGDPAVQVLADRPEGAAYEYPVNGGYTATLTDADGNMRSEYVFIDWVPPSFVLGLLPAMLAANGAVTFSFIIDGVSIVEPVPTGPDPISRENFALVARAYLQDRLEDEGLGVALVLQRLRLLIDGATDLQMDYQP